MRPVRPCSSLTAASSARSAGGEPSYPTTRCKNAAGGVGEVIAIMLTGAVGRRARRSGWRGRWSGWGWRRSGDVRCDQAGKPALAVAASALAMPGQVREHLADGLVDNAVAGVPHPQEARIRRDRDSLPFRGAGRVGQPLTDALGVGDQERLPEGADPGRPLVVAT